MWLYKSMNCNPTSLNTLWVSKWRLILESVSYGLSYACSTKANSSFCAWFNLDLTEYAYLSLSSARVNIFVSCL